MKKKLKKASKQCSWLRREAFSTHSGAAPSRKKAESVHGHQILINLFCPAIQGPSCCPGFSNC